MVHSLPGSTGKNRPWSRRCSFSCCAGDAGLDAAVHVGRVDLEDAGHAREVEADAATDRGDVAFERRAGAEGDDGDAVLVAESEDAGGLLAALDERDGVGQDGGLHVLAVAVLLAQRVVGGNPLAEEVAGLGDDGVDLSGHRRVLKAGEQHVEGAGDFVAVVGQIAAGAAQFHPPHRGDQVRRHQQRPVVDVQSRMKVTSRLWYPRGREERYHDTPAEIGQQVRLHVQNVHLSCWRIEIEPRH